MPGVLMAFRGLPARLRAIDGFVGLSFGGVKNEFSNVCITLVVLGLLSVEDEYSETIFKSSWL